MVYKNLNPKGLKTGDCVIRAIAYATEKEWEEVYEALCKLGLKMKRMPNEKQVYEKYLEQLGWQKYKQPRKWNNTKYTLDEFIEEMASEGDAVLVKLAHHLSVVEEGQVVDTWDCGYKTVGNYWIRRN